MVKWMYGKKKFPLRFFIVPVLVLLALVPPSGSVNAVVVVPPTWTQTSQAEFNTGTLFQTDTAASPDNVTLAKANNGFVYAFEGNGTKLFWRYNITSNTWTNLHEAPQTVGAGGALAYDGGNYVYALGGNGCNYFWRYNITTDTWASLAITLSAVNIGGALVFTGGDYLYAFQGNGNKTFWRYSISGNTWATLTNCTTAINGGAALTYSSGNSLIYALCGQSRAFYQYSIGSNSWTALTITPDTIGDGGSLAADGSNYIYALKGSNTVTYWRYSISGNSWTPMHDTPATPCVYGGGALVYDKTGSLYALRGYSHTDYWKYTVTSDNWTTLYNTPAAVDYGGALTYQSPTYYTSGTFTSSTFDPGWATDWNSIYWTSAAPSGTTLRFQIATNTDNTSWTFRGPDGATTSYYTTSYATIWSGHNTDRFIRYKVFFDTTNNVVTPTLNDISITYNRHIYVPTATTAAAAAVEETTSTLRGSVANDGGEACHYQFNYGTASGNYTVDTGWSAGTVITGQNFSFDSSALTQGITYYYRAQLKNSKGTASDGELTFLTKPEDPASLAAASANSTQVNLTWIKGTGANRTKVLRKTGSYPTDYNDGTPVYFGTDTGYSDAGLSANTSYYYRAWSEVTAGSLQQWSDNYDSATTATTTAPTANTFDATAVEETTATLHGSVVTDGSELCQYQFVYGNVHGGPYPNSTGWTGGLSAGQAFTVDLTSLGKGTPYYYAAQVKNSAGTGTGPEIHFLTKPDPPFDDSFATADTNYTSITLNWIKGEGAQKTYILRKIGGYSDNRTDGLLIYFDTGTTFTDTGLTPDTVYYYTAWSWAGGSEQWSDGFRAVFATSAPASPPPTTPPTTPVSVGGTVFPVDKLGILMPYLAAGGALLLLAAGFLTLRFSGRRHHA
jgi:hypothetical protein